MEVWQHWWAWVVGGLVLSIIEMLLPTGYILLGFSGGAVLTGVLIALSISGTSLPMTMLVWAILSGLSWVGLRMVFGAPATQQKRRITRDINDHHPPLN